ncbi:MAG TPA: GntR family transcriptional regulator [Longimicrobiales bacterium]|nr:GntR family transcriptional regulator [Longimicrobiales bacterium]
MDANEIVQRVAGRLRESGADPVAHVAVEELWLAVVDGSLGSGERLPTPRQLAIGLNDSPRSIERAYAELERRGVVVSRAGAGTFVSLAPASESDRARHQQFAALCRETVDRATTLGFSIDELIDGLAEFRTADRDDRSLEPPS